VNSSLKKLVSRILLAAILINAIGSVSAGVTNKSVLLCTSQGYKWVNVEDDNNTTHQIAGCELCITSSNDDLENCIDTDSMLSVLSVISQTHKAVGFDSETTISKYFIAQGRAPPY